MLLDLEEQECLARLWAKKAAEARAAQQSLEWKMVARKRSRQAKFDGTHRDDCHAPFLDVPQQVSPDSDIEEAKLMRASSRATNLHIKRSQFRNSCNVAFSCRRVGYGAKPHRNVRAAARTY